MPNASGIGWWFQPVPQIWWSFIIIPIIWIPNSKSAWIPRRISGCRWLPYICLYPQKILLSICLGFNTMWRKIIIPNFAPVKLQRWHGCQQAHAEIKATNIVATQKPRNRLRCARNCFLVFVHVCILECQTLAPVKKCLRARSQFLEHAVKHWHLPLTGFSTTHVATWHTMINI